VRVCDTVTCAGSTQLVVFDCGGDVSFGWQVSGGRESLPRRLGQRRVVSSATLKGKRGLVALLSDRVR